MRENIKMGEEKERRKLHFGISLLNVIGNIYIKHAYQHVLCC